MDGSWCPAVDTDETDTEGTAEEKAQNACLVIALSCTASFIFKTRDLCLCVAFVYVYYNVYVYMSIQFY